MAWETPDAYFPDDLLVKFGFTNPRLWSTIVAKAPGGQRQSHPLQLYPTRKCSATIIGYDRSAFKAIDDFLFTRMGMFKPYYVFNWYRKDFTQEPRKPIPVPAGVIGPGTELVLPFKEGTVQGIYVDEVLEFVVEGVGYVTDDGGPAGEKRIISVFGNPTFTLGQTIQVQISDTRERIAVASVSDTDDFQFDWSAAEPPVETGLQVEEVF